MVEMLGGRKVPSDFYVLVKLVSQLSSLYSTDVREALVIQSEETQNSKTVCLRISRRPYQLLCSKPKRVDSEMGDSRERRYYVSINVVCARNCHVRSWFVSS